MILISVSVLAELVGMLISSSNLRATNANTTSSISSIRSSSRYLLLFIILLFFLIRDDAEIHMMGKYWLPMVGTCCMEKATN